MLVNISDLIPQEPAAVRGSYEWFLNLIDEGKVSRISPIKIATIAGEFLVREGNTGLFLAPDSRLESIVERLAR